MYAVFLVLDPRNPLEYLVKTNYKKNRKKVKNKRIIIEKTQS